MTGTKEGGKKAALTNKQREPEFYKRIGSIGGKNRHAGTNINGVEKMTSEQREIYKTQRADGKKINVE